MPNPQFSIDFECNIELKQKREHLNQKDIHIMNIFLVQMLSLLFQLNITFKIY